MATPSAAGIPTSKRQRHQHNAGNSYAFLRCDNLRQHHEQRGYGFTLATFDAQQSSSTVGKRGPGGDTHGRDWNRPAVFGSNRPFPARH